MGKHFFLAAGHGVGIRDADDPESRVDARFHQQLRAAAAQPAIYTMFFYGDDRFRTQADVHYSLFIEWP